MEALSTLDACVQKKLLPLSSFSKLFIPAACAALLIGSAVRADDASANTQTNSDLFISPTRLKRPVQATTNDGSFDKKATEPFKLGAQKLHIPAYETEDTFAPKRGTGQFDEARPPFALSALQNHALLEQGEPPTITVKLLSNFDIDIIVDQSMSMRKRDCPGGLSRWQWCGLQTTDLAKRLGRLIPNGFTLTTFANDYQVYEHASAQDMIGLFENPQFQLGTRLSRPLQDRLNNHFRQRSTNSKPALIVVITDGVPHPFTEPDFVANTLIAASRKMTDAHEVTVVFLQIGGGDFRGRRFLSSMDNDLVSYGARYDFVQTMSFEQLEDKGLAEALALCIKDFANQKHNQSR